VKKIYLLPNLFTTASLCCGMLAVIRVFENEPQQACWLILLSAILDGLDGKIARLTHSESAFGVNYDSLSDLVAFGVAPAALMFNVLSDESSMKIASGVTTLYTICGALRLARFNVQRTREEKRSFTGLPIPAAAGTVVAAYLVYHRLDPITDWPAKTLPFLIVILSCLMVSKVPYPSLKSVNLEGRQPFDYLVTIIAALCVILVLQRYREYLLLSGFLAYMGYGVGRAIVVLVRHKQPVGAGVPMEGEDEPRQPLSLEK